MTDVPVTGTMAQGQFNELLVVLSFGKENEGRTSVMKTKRGRETRQDMDDA